MNTAKLLGDPLVAFELEVARRADELARHDGSAGKNALELWTEAERDILECRWSPGSDGRSPNWRAARWRISRANSQVNASG